jgi:hypothetical protein
LRADVPTRAGVPGVLGVEGAWERLRVALDTTGASVVEETWRSAAVAWSGWLTPGVRQAATVGFERWSGDRRYSTFEVATELRGWGDRLRVGVSGAQAVALSEHSSYRRGRVEAMWASSPGLVRAAWSARVGGDWVSADAPLGAWSVVGGSPSSDILLRAEPSPRGGFVAGRAVGRAILHGGLAGDVPVHREGPLVLAVGAFLDAARIAGSADGSVGPKSYLDGGVGLRIGIGDGELGVLRVDVARGLFEEGRSTLSVGVHRRSRRRRARPPRAAGGWAS